MRVGGLRRRRYSFGKVTGHCGTNAQPRPASPMPTTSARDVLFPRRDSTPRKSNVSNVARKGLSDELSVRPIALSLLRMPPLISTTLADLLTPPLGAHPFSTMRASLRRQSSEELDDCVAHGGQSWLRRRAVDSFFSASLLRDGGAGGRRKRSLS